jgi:hypothetical protein
MAVCASIQGLFNEAANVPRISLSIAVEMVIFPSDYVNTGADDAGVCCRQTFYPVSLYVLVFLYQHDILFSISLPYLLQRANASSALYRTTDPLVHAIVPIHLTLSWSCRSWGL